MFSIGAYKKNSQFTLLTLQTMANGFGVDYKSQTYLRLCGHRVDNHLGLILKKEEQLINGRYSFIKFRVIRYTAKRASALIRILSVTLYAFCQVSSVDRFLQLIACFLTIIMTPVR